LKVASLIVPSATSSRGGFCGIASALSDSWPWTTAAYRRGVPDQPTQQPPPVQKIRIRYAKRDRLRFTSHRDFGRAFERAVRRAGIPVAYSSGFSPHPRISYANASPTGAASEAEYLEISLAAESDPAQVRVALDEALPAGLDILDAVVATPGGGSLADRLEAGAWTIELPEVPVVQVSAAVAAFLDRDTVEVQRMTKRGIRTFDARGAVVSLGVRAGSQADGAACAILDVVVRHGTPSVRPDDILAGLREVSGLVAPVSSKQTRLAQGPLDSETGGVSDPLGPDRDASATADRDR
jgi:radical SAM-linked protein